MLRLLYDLWKIRNFERIPKLPRMLATHYETVTDEERRIMARLGVRDPAGIKAALKRHKVKTIQELIAVLEHQQPKHKFWENLWLGLARLVGGDEHEPHARELRMHYRRKPDTKAIEARVREVKQWFK